MGCNIIRGSNNMYQVVDYLPLLSPCTCRPLHADTPHAPLFSLVVEYELAGEYGKFRSLMGNSISLLNPHYLPPPVRFSRDWKVSSATVPCLSEPCLTEPCLNLSCQCFGQRKEPG